MDTSYKLLVKYTLLCEKSDHFISFDKFHSTNLYELLTIRSLSYVFGGLVYKILSYNTILILSTFLLLGNNLFVALLTSVDNYVSLPILNFCLGLLNLKFSLGFHDCAVYN